jgi:hypothetical protein
MKITKHFVLAALLVLGAAAPAMAWGKHKASLYAVGDEPNASGYAVTEATDRTTFHVLFKVSCSGLMPGETYIAWTWQWDPMTGGVTEAFIGGFVADGRSKGTTGWTVVDFPRGPVEVYRWTDGTLVLSTTPP